MGLRTEDEKQLIKVIDAVDRGVMPQEFQLSEESPDEAARLVGDRLGTGEVGAWRLAGVPTYDEAPYINNWETNNGSNVSADYEILSGGNKIDDVSITISPSGDRRFNFNVSYSTSRSKVEDKIRSEGSNIVVFRKKDEEKSTTPEKPEDSDEATSPSPPPKSTLDNIKENPGRVLLLGIVIVALWRLF